MFDTIAEMLRGSAPDDLAHALGTDRTQTRRAMEIGLPALIAGLRDKALEPGGAQSLSSLLGQDESQLPSDLGAYLSGGDPSKGASVLDVAFGDRGEPALAALSQASGLSTRLLAQVMSVLAPLATGLLATTADQSPDGLRGYLGDAVVDLEDKGFGRVVELVSPAMPVAAEVFEGADTGDEASDAGAAAAGGLLVGDDSFVDDGTVVQGAFPDAAPSEEVQVGAGGPSFVDDVVDMSGSGSAPDFGDPAMPGAVAVDERPDIEVEADYDDGNSLSAMGWLWWLIAAILGVLLLLFLISQCGDDDESPDTPAASTTDVTPVAEPTADALAAELQVALDNVLSEYSGATGQVVDTIAVINGTAVDDREKALVDQAARAVPGITGVQNNLTVSAAAPPQGYSLNDIIAAQPELSTLKALLDQAGLGVALEGNGPFTLFAPTNEAFAAAQSQLDAVQGDRDALQQLLQYHIVNGATSGADVAASQALPSLQGELIDVSALDGEVRLNQLVPILVGDAQGRNGVMHVVSGVLFPPSFSAASPEEIGAALDLAPISFAAGSADITADGTAELDLVVEFLLANPIDIEIGGHTDSDGDAGFNQTLSQERADAVKDYLTSQGVPSASLTAVGYGPDQPIAPNDTPENKAKNRRIEFRPI